ncbi:MAG: hypothetical protein LAO19_17985 [Acidobacteriia bacterium]|nr:hypothetical protein [Terriglobia bacterium]
MKTSILVALLAVISCVVAAKYLFFSTRTISAAPQVNFGECVSTVPQDWGAFRGGSEQSGLAFEDKQGTLRFVTNFPCNGVVHPVALEIRRAPLKN